MTNESEHLSENDLKLISRAVRELNTAELRDLINTSIQYGPPITTRGRMHQINQFDVHPTFWGLLEVFVEWGAGDIYHDQNIDSQSLRANSDHLERMLKLIAERLNSAAGEGDIQSSLIRQFQRQKIKPKKIQDSSLEPW